MSTKDHGDDHDHLFGNRRIDPHGDEQVQHLIQGEQDTQVIEGIGLVLEIDPDEFRDEIRHRQEWCRKTEGQQIFRQNRQGCPVDDKYCKPYDYGCQYKVKTFFLFD